MVGRIVVVTNPFEAELVRRELVRAGREVVLLDPEEATATACVSDSPALIVVGLPTEPGSVDAAKSLCRAVRATPRGAAIPVLLIGPLRDLADATLAGGDDFLPRPVDPTLLMEKAGAFLGTLRLRRPTAPPPPVVPTHDEAFWWDSDGGEPGAGAAKAARGSTVEVLESPAGANATDGSGAVALSGPLPEPVAPAPPQDLP